MRMARTFLFPHCLGAGRAYLPPLEGKSGWPHKERWGGIALLKPMGIVLALDGCPVPTQLPPVNLCGPILSLTPAMGWG